MIHIVFSGFTSSQINFVSMAIKLIACTMIAHAYCVVVCTHMATLRSGIQQAPANHHRHSTDNIQVINKQNQKSTKQKPQEVD